MTSLPMAPLALVVEDDPVTRRLLHRALDELGCRSVLEAEDGLAAQALLLERSDVDLVLTDILMPRLDGLELLRWGREHDPNTIWIILSGLDTFDSAVEAIRLGAFDFLSKPPRVAELEVAVRNALERRTLLLERERLHADLRESNEQLAAKLRELEEKSALLQRDLEGAEVIQRALLPSAPPPIDGYCVHALYRPGHHVGGDLYDVARLDERHVALYMADATGHGVTAAMLSVLFKLHLVVRDENNGEPLGPAAVLEAVNRELQEAVAARGLFLTAVYALLDTETGSLRVASAGHPPVLHIPAAGEVRLIRRTGPALGLSADAHFGEQRLELNPGDRLFLYTDGLVQSGALSPEDHFAGLLRPAQGDGAATLRKLLSDAQTAAREEDQDDVTLLLLDVHSSPSSFDNGTTDTRPVTSRASPSRAGVVCQGETADSGILALHGRATWGPCAAFHQAAVQVLQSGKRLLLDLSHCESLDSTCLGTIHELVGRGKVGLQNVRPEVQELFAELCMEKVIANIQPESVLLPRMSPLAAPPTSTEMARKRILEAHEAISSLSERNRETFRSVLEGVRQEEGSG